MQPFRLGVVNFLNAYPLWAALEHEPGIQLVPDVPSRLALELRAGKLDAALISSVEYLRHPAGFVYHTQLCIATTRESWSIRLFVPDARQNFVTHVQKIRRIFTDVASRSSVAQLQVILHELGLSPQLEEVTGAGDRIASLKDGEALLAIGDTALAHRTRPSYDMQQEYFSLFHHGFVYALWVCRAEKSAALAPILQDAYQKWSVRKETLSAEAALRFGFETDFAKDYLSRIIEHRLTPEHDADLRFFADRLKKL
ncbi:MAG: menaquinone biosynthetic enzyme MqnA/MqnD family protein [Spirochaetota bacterium]